MSGEFAVYLPFQALGLLGLTVFFGVHALLYLRILSGGGLIFFSGNTVAAALILGSNLGGAPVLWVLLQIILIAIALIAMIALFFEPRST